MKQIYLNLPVTNIERSMVFYESLGFTIKSLFSDEQQKCMVWCEAIYVMLMSIEKFQSYSGKSIPEIKINIASFYTLPVESADTMDSIVDNGLKAGGIEPIQKLDTDFMKLRRIEDLDGHTWDIICMDISKLHIETPRT